jgi:hypothetical protein
VGGFLSGIVFLKLFLQIPQTGITKRLRHATTKKKTPRLQVVRAIGPATDPHLYGHITITPEEAEFGTKKLVNMPRSYQKRLFRITVPPGVNDGATLRLSGLGKQMDGEKKGNLYLKVLIHSRH